MTVDTHPPLPAMAETNKEGCLVFAGIPLPLLAQRIGRTPFFAYSRQLLTARIEQLRQALPSDVHLSYAIKANPMPAVVQHLSHLVDGFDVASAGEMKVALDTPMPVENVSFAGPGKRLEEVSQAISAGVLLNVESENELKAVAAEGTRLGIKPRVALRVNPGFEVKSSGLRMGGGAKPFGIDAEQMPEILDSIKAMNVRFEGFQIFSGSQILDASSLRQAQQETADLAIELSKVAPGDVRVVNIGGGFGIPYFPGERALDLEAVGVGLSSVIPRIRAGLANAKIVVELGRYIVGEAGIYVCRVVDRKDSRDKTYLVTDGGLHHHLAASGNLGQVIRRNFPVAVGNRMTSEQNETVDVVGCLCTPIDVLARQVRLPACQVGDFIVIFQSGAYGATGSPVNFLSHPEPVEVLV